MEIKSYLPRAICIYLTTHCYLSCKHCFLTENKSINKFTLKFNDVSRILDDAAKHKTYIVQLTGGDPLLHPDCFEIISAIKKRNMMPLLGISGINIKDETVERIQQAGIPSIQLSLDGPNEEVNSLYRGKNIFQEVIKSSRKLINAGVKVNISIVIDKNNISFIEDFLKFCIEEGFYKIKIAPRTPIPSMREELKEVLLSEKELSNLIIRVKKFESTQNRKNWAMFATEINNTNNNAMARLVIYANGDIHLSEYGKLIGNINNTLPSKAFTSYLY